MIALLTTRDMNSREPDASHPVGRVREHLQMAQKRSDARPADPRVRNDLRGFLARLQKLRSRPGFEGVEMSSHAVDAVRSLKVVGNEMLTLLPEKRGA